MTRYHFLFLTLLLAIAVPFAAADTIQLSNNNLGIAGSIGTVTLTQQGAGQVLVTVTANSGFSLKLNGGSVFFNTNATLNALNFGTITADGNTVTFAHLRTGQNVDGRGIFSFQLLNFQGAPSQSASTISFMITAPGLTVKQLELANAKGNMWGVHFCVGSVCGATTGFAAGSLAVPEPGTLSLLGTGIVALAGIFRRRFLS
ncbi:MAG TPA: PEP-CTERM sorting domain-containing protein [Terriglobales bacterium]|nr:PEP-CTERM sorting domain-containing protein [Terriglobales bacterium]